MTLTALLPAMPSPPSCFNSIFFAGACLSLDPSLDCAIPPHDGLGPLEGVLVFLNTNRKIPQAYGITVVAFTWWYSGYRISTGNGGTSSN
jgi:hypothetical protein